MTDGRKRKDVALDDATLARARADLASLQSLSSLNTTVSDWLVEPFAGGRTRPTVRSDATTATIEWEGTSYPVSHAWGDAFQAMIDAKGQPVGLSRFLRKPADDLKRLAADFPELVAIVAKADGNRGYRLTIFDAQK